MFTKEVKNMSNKIRFTIDEDLLEAVGTVIPGEKSPISLFRGSGQPVTGETMSRIRSAGIIDESGKIKGEYQHAAETLARTRCFSRLKFSAGEKIFEFIVYFPTDNSVPVSIIHNNNQLMVQEPAAFEEAFSLIDQNTGHSILSSCTFNGEFSQHEALALFALMDLERSTLLSGLAQESDALNAAFDLDMVMNKITNRKEHLQSLEYVIQSRIILNTLPTQKDLESACKTLAEKGFVVRQGEKFRLSDALYAVAGRLLIIDSFVVIETGRLDESGTMSGGSFISLQAGVNDILYIEGHAEEIIVKYITGFELMDLIGKFLSDPTIITTPEQVQPVTSAQQPAANIPGKKFCPSCGTAIQAGKKFCPQCGAKIS
jgi:hypothetical protein